MKSRYTYLEKKYSQQDTPIPFEVFVNNSTDSKVKKQAISNLISLHIIPPKKGSLHILDIGCGNGDLLAYLTSLLICTGTNISLDLIDVSEDMLRFCKQNLLNTDKGILSKRFYHTSWDNIDLEDENYDIILASHIYIDRDQYETEIAKMFSHLAPNGVIIFISNTKDIAYQFRNKFRPLLFSKAQIKKYPPQLIEDFYDVIKRLYSDKYNLSITNYDTTLTFPKLQTDEGRQIVEFLLGKPWRDIPNEIQNEIMGFIENSNYTFNCKLGVLTVQS